MKTFSLFFIVLVFSSCSKSTYLIKQGVGQMDLLLSAEDNSELLQGSKLTEIEKEKIQNIIRYKQYFERFFKKSSGDIYNRTTVLKRDAVSYLVVVTPFDQIKAKETSFPFYGSFPYLGFFSEEDAKKYQEEWEEKDYITYRRPVLAYSTLGTFDDPILSPFFRFPDYELAELVFHELFHSIFFIKDNVELNENLASFFGRRMAEEYFDLSPQEKEQKKREREFFQEFLLRTNKLVKTVNQEYQEKQPKDHSEAKEILTIHVALYRQSIKKLCDQYKIESEDCYPLKRQWNNASLAAFSTYSNKAKLIDKLYESRGEDLKKFYFYLESVYEEYREKDPKLNFSEYLRSKV